MNTWPAFVLSLALLAPSPVYPHDAAHDQRLPMIATAPDFSLTSHDGQAVSLADYRGKVVAVTFIYTSCVDTCPTLTAIMAHVQDKLGPAFGPKVAFVSITIDPERDTPEVLEQYARNFGANLAGWAFLTGDPPVVSDIARRYGVFVAKTAAGDIDHTFLTSLIDQHGNLRVQYLGVRFDLEEFRGDLLSLLGETQ
jgi:protein SCO1/2